MTASPTRSAVRSGRWGLWTALAVFGLVLLLPAPPGLPGAAQRLLAVTALMTILWVTQAIPLAVTSLIPLSAYPLLGIASAGEVSRSYMNDSILVYFGGFLIAIAIERWGLHRRWALQTVRCLGTSPKRLLLGFMIATAFISMWISNTATTLMMLPIGLALMTAFEACLERADNDPSLPREPSTIRAQLAPLAGAIPLGIAYAASCGGMATLVGSPTNIVFVGQWNALIREGGGTPVSAGSWMMCCLPIAVLMTLAAWWTLAARLKPIPKAGEVGREFFRERLQALGPMSPEEWHVSLVFFATAGLWVFRGSLEFGTGWSLPGWGPVLSRWMQSVWGLDSAWADSLVNDSTVAMTAAIVLFLVPARPSSEGLRQRLLDWPQVEHRLPWGIILLFGGGFAMADAFGSTGLSAWLGTCLHPLGHLHPILLAGCVCLLMTFLTEFTSNVATTTTLLPILASLAVSLQLDPRVLMVPASLSASCAFMLPVATPPNAIVFGSGQVTMKQMVTAGFRLNLIGVIVVTLVTSLLLGPVLGAGR